MGSLERGPKFGMGTARGARSEGWVMGRHVGGGAWSSSGMEGMHESDCVIEAGMGVEVGRERERGGWVTNGM